MSLAVVKVEIDFSSGATFDPALVLDDPGTPLDVAVLGTAPADVIDISAFVTETFVSRAFNRSADSFTAGTAKVVFIDQTGLFNPANTSSEYFGKITPMRKVRIGATFNDVFYNLGAFYVQQWNYQSPAGFDPAIVTINCVDGFQLLNLTTITAVTGGTAGQTTGARITTLLDAGGWPAMRDISSTSTTTVQADTGTSRSLLGALQTVEQTECGALYVDEVGFVKYMSRNDIITQSGTAVTKFSDVFGSGDVTYQKVEFDISDFQMVNSATVTPSGLTGQKATSPASIADYFEHSRTRSGIMQTESDALNQARMVVASRSEQGVNLQLQSLMIDAYTGNDPARVTAALELDIFSPIEVTQTYPAGVVVSDSLIAGVQYQITPRSFFVTFTCAQPFAVGFLLDSTTDGILDIDILSY